LIVSGFTTSPRDQAKMFSGLAKVNLTDLKVDVLYIEV